MLVLVSVLVLVLVLISVLVLVFGIGVGVVIGFSIRIGICVGVGIGIAFGTGSISQHLAISGITWWHPGASGRIWQHLGAYLAASGLAASGRKHLAATGSIWAGSTWHHLAPSGTIRALEPGNQEKAFIFMKPSTKVCFWYQK